MLEVIILINVPALNQNDFDALINLASLNKQERIKLFRFEQDAHNCLLGDILARIEICRITGFNNKQLEFSTNVYGKPFLINNPHIHYNISHAGHYVVCAISDEPIGIDIELIKPVDLKIAERFFAPDETAYIMDAEQIYRFYKVWTKKESRIKWEGQGLHKSLPSFSVLDSVEKEAIFYHMVFYNGEAICHICSNKRMRPSVRVTDTDILLQHIKQTPNFIHNPP